MKAAPPPPKKTSAPTLLHTIHFSGENLSLIALWYTGSTSNWKEILKANPRVTPDRLKQGMQIKIPATLVKRREVLPRSFVAAHLELATATQKPVSNETTSKTDSKASPNTVESENSTGAPPSGRVILTSPSEEIEQRRKAVLEELLN